MQVTMEDFDSGFGASPDGLGATVRMGGFGDDAIAPAASQGPAGNPGPNTMQALKVAYAIASMAGSAMGAYHGYKRNDSIGWAIGWAFLGGLFPVIVIPVAFAQGFGERK